jgi:hypothetical protein
MRGRKGEYSLCLGLIVFALATTGCMIGKRGGGGGGGGGGGMLLPGATLTSLSPSSIPAGSPPFTLTINGSGFVAGGSLSWNGTVNLGQYTFVSSTQVTVQIAANLITTPGTGSIVASIPTPMTTPSNALTLTIAPLTSSACVLFGLYDFFFTGFDSNGPVTAAGDFGVDATGHVSGEEDFKDPAGTRAAQPITGGSCTNGSTANEGTLTITTAAGTSTYTFVTQALPAPGRTGRMAESGDTNGISGSGQFFFAPPGSFFSGDYVLALVGSDSSGGRMSVLGRFTDTDNNNTQGTLSSGMGDINDNGALTPSVPITGTVSVPDLYSRSTVTLTLGTQTLNLALYVRSAQLGVAVDTDSGGSSPLLAGFINGQAGAGLYNNGLLSAPVVFSTWGASPGPPAASDTSIGIASGFNATAGTFNLQLDAVTNGVASLNRTVTGGTYSIASNGRATLSYNLGGKTFNFILYLDAFNDGYILGTSGNVDFGFFEAQAAGPFNASTIDGTFAGGSWFSPVSTSPDTVAQITLNNGSVSAGPLTGAYAVDPSGRGTATVNLPLFGSNDLVFYIIGPGSIEVMGSDNVTDDSISFLHQ